MNNEETKSALDENLNNEAIEVNTSTENPEVSENTVEDSGKDFMFADVPIKIESIAQNEEITEAGANQPEEPPMVDSDNIVPEITTENIASTQEQIEINEPETLITAVPETSTADTVSEQPTADKSLQEIPQTDITTAATAVETKDKAVSEAEQAAQREYKSQRQKLFDAIYEELKTKIDSKETIEVEVKARIRGGLRVHYKDLPMFLPTSHYTLKRNPSEEEMQASIGQKFEVYVHEFQEFDEGRKAVIVSRKKMLMKDIWNKIQPGDIIDGRVSSIAPFGVFVEFNGLEGLIHISRLSKSHIDDPNKHFKRGQDIQAKILEINKDKNKIALSRKELEGSPWKGIEQEVKPGMIVKGIVRRLTEFGAYIELKSGVDGLLRNNELSWTKRVRKPADLLSLGQEINVEIMSISEEKESASLSYKRTQPNPWLTLAEKYPLGSEHEGTILQVIPQGAIVNITEDIDGFMPRSKMRPFMKGKKIPYASGEKLKVIITDLNPAEESLILTPRIEENPAPQRQNENRQSPAKPKPTPSSTFSLGDMLSETELQRLHDINK